MSSVKEKKRSYFMLKLLLSVVIILSAAAVAVAYYPALLFAAPGDLSAEVAGEYGSGSADGETVNIALLGFDRPASSAGEGGIYRPDTIMIASINLQAAEVRLVSIPRDSYVQIYGTDTRDKINHSYMYGYIRAAEGENQHESGLKTTLLTIREFLGGVPLHGFISVNMGGAADIIDSIGGIYYDVEFDVRSNFGQGRLLVEEGYQLLSGKEFMHYIRNRAGHQGGERGRTQRQQQVMIALFDQLKGPQGLLKIPRLYSAVMNNMETDLNMAQMGALGVLGLRVNPSAVDTYVFNGQGQLSDQNGQNIWYLVIDEQTRVEIIEAVFGVIVEARSLPTLPGPLTPEPQDPEPEPFPEIEPELEPEPDPDLEPDPDPDSEEEAEPEIDPDPDPDLEPEPDPDPDPEPDSDPDFDPDLVPDPDLEPEPEEDPESDPAEENG